MNAIAEVPSGPLGEFNERLLLRGAKGCNGSVGDGSVKSADGQKQTVGSELSGLAISGLE
jgi:hypothetical protein